MSSVTRFIRQIPVSTTYYDATNAATLAYVFVPGDGNYVGNYPPGVMQLASSGAAGSPGASMAGAIGAVGTTGAVLRDMGKTIYAAIADTASTPVAVVPPQFGYFREVQLLTPPALNYIGSQAGTQIIGGTSGTTFGVGGATTSDYLTFYIPVTVAGVRAGVAGNVYAIAGGQM
jgi:hypothetical protein